MDVTRRVGGIPLFHAVALLLFVANVGAGLTGQVAGARLLFGMGRDNVLPRRFFSYLDPKRNTPTLNILLIGGLAFVGAQVLSYELTAEILNFGAFLGFIGVNLAAIWQFYVIGQPGRQKNLFEDAIVPAIGLIFCLVIWWGLGTPAKVAGSIWFAVGLIHCAIRTRGFRERPVMIDLGES